MRIFVFTLFSFTIFAEKPLFDSKELEALKYLSSKEYVGEKMFSKNSKESEAKMAVALKLYVKQDQAMRKHFFRPGLWDREDKRENFLAMQGWLQEISPITPEKNKKDEKK